jgi:hypothetical protein
LDRVLSKEFHANEANLCALCAVGDEWWTVVGGWQVVVAVGQRHHTQVKYMVVKMAVKTVVTTVIKMMVYM